MIFLLLLWQHTHRKGARHFQVSTGSKPSQEFLDARCCTTACLPNPLDSCNRQPPPAPYIRPQQQMTSRVVLQSCCRGLLLNCMRFINKWNHQLLLRTTPSGSTCWYGPASECWLPAQAAMARRDATLLQMVRNAGALREAPPTRKPSMSGWVARSLQLPSFTDPP